MEASLIPSPTIHMWFTFAMIVGGLLLFASEKLLVEVVSLILLSALLLFFHFYPLADAQGKILVSAADILQGFSNPALIAVMALLVLGQAVIRTGALIGITNVILKLSRSSKFFSISLTQILTTFVSTFINDTPTCVMFMPVMSTLARKLKISASKVMIPLSYAAILGGTVTLIGSSTNLLVSGAVEKAGMPPLGLFDFTLPGLIIAGVGLVYVLLILPFLLPSHAPLSSELHDPTRQFFGQVDVDINSPLAGLPANSPELFGKLDIAPKMLQRGEHAFLPPFEGSLIIKPGDVLIFTATRAALTELVSEKNRTHFGALQTSMEMDGGTEKSHADLSLAEILVPPNSRMIGRTISQIGLHQNHNCIVLGIQRRARTITSRMTEQRLAPGDVLLIMGKERDVHMLRKNRDMMLMEWSTEELPSQTFARKSLLIFALTVALAAFEIVPIHISAVVGATLLIVTRCLNWQQARRAIGTQIIMLVAAGLALSTALEATGGATYIAYNIVNAMNGLSPLIVMAAMFLFMGLVTNVLSNNATALIFTPIAIDTAHLLKADPYMFIFAVIFASNCCSFATPIGYQTNLLVMGPGHYRFMDYVKGGMPLLILVWLTYAAFCYFYFGYAPETR